MTPWYIFPNDPNHDTSMATHDVAGWTLTAIPTTHPSNGAPCQMFSLPDGTPDGNGCRLTITDIHGKLQYNLHGVLYLHLPTGAGLVVDIFPLRQVPVPAPALAPINPQGRFTFAGGQRLRWRGITAFRLLEFVAHGREADAETYLSWCLEHRVYPRVLCMAKHLFELNPRDGVAALPRFLEMAADHRVYCELTALADTKSYPGMDLGWMVDAVGNSAFITQLARVEIANEVLPLHPTQDDRLGNLDVLASLARRVPSGVAVSLGSNHNGSDEDRSIAHKTQSFPNGYITDHMDRTDEENGWKWVRHTNELGWISDDTNLDSINDEPKRSDLTPGKHLALAVLCHAIRDIGNTFHYGGGLHGLIPTGAELAAFQGCEQGWNLIEAETWFHHGTYRNAGQGWPVKGFTNANRVYSSVQGNRAITLALDAANVHIDWDEHARPEQIIELDGARVYRVTTI